VNRTDIHLCKLQIQQANSLITPNSKPAAQVESVSSCEGSINDRYVRGAWWSALAKPAAVLFSVLPSEEPKCCCLFFSFFSFWVTGELSTLRQLMKVPNEPGLSPNNGLGNVSLSDQSMASNPRKGQVKCPGAKTTSHDGRAGHVMTHMCHPSKARRMASVTISRCVFSGWTPFACLYHVTYVPPE